MLDVPLCRGCQRKDGTAPRCPAVPLVGKKMRRIRARIFTWRPFSSQTSKAWIVWHLQMSVREMVDVVVATPSRGVTGPDEALSSRPLRVCNAQEPRHS